MTVLQDNSQAYLAERDPVLSRILADRTTPTWQNSGDIFYDLVSCIVDQQMPHRSKGVYMRKLSVLLGGEYPNPELLLSLDSHDFAAQKMAAPKFRSLQSLAQYWQDHSLQSTKWIDLSDEAVRALLQPIRGVGTWTIDMILLFSLHRKDVFPLDDYQLKQAMRACYGLPDGAALKKEMKSIAEVWAPHRSLAACYLLDWWNENKGTR